MNYFPFHIGDYASDTAHLEPMEDLAYRRMLDLYYRRESALHADPAEVARLIRLRNCLEEVKAVLGEFFDLSDDGWRHVRCDEEIKHMQKKQSKARESAAASVHARKAKADDQPRSERSTNAQRTLNKRSADVELPTPTPTPISVLLAQGGRDMKEWAKVIVAREKAGDKVPQVSLRFAREALDIKVGT